MIRMWVCGAEGSTIRNIGMYSSIQMGQNVSHALLPGKKETPRKGCMCLQWAEPCYNSEIHCMYKKELDGDENRDNARGKHLS